MYSPLCILSAVIKCISDPLDLISVNCHHIKSAWKLPISITEQIKLCRPADPTLFLKVYGCCRFSGSCCRPVFHFYKNKIFSVFRNQVNLASPAEKIVFKDLKPLFFQKGSRLFFMTTAYFTFVDTRPLFSFLCVGIFGIYKILYEVCDKTCSVYRGRTIFLEGFNVLR